MLFLIYALALLISFYLLAKVCDDYFVEALDKIATHWKMSNDVAGATLMAVGSSAPELFVAVFAVIRPGNHEIIGVGNILGSAIFNILVITGMAGIVRASKIIWQPVIRDIIFYSVSVLLVIYFFWDGEITIEEVITFLVIYVIYVLAVMNWKKILPYKDDLKDEDTDEEPETERKWYHTFTRPFDFVLSLVFPSQKHYYLVFTISIIIIAALSWVLVESAIEISHILNVPEALIALTVLAIGTSVPDLFSSIIVAKQGRGGMAISNAIGSNIFDILVGLGIPFLIMIAIHGLQVKVLADDMVVSASILFGTVLVLLTLFLVNKWIIGKKMGYTLIFLYIAYVIYNIVMLYV